MELDYVEIRVYIVLNFDLKQYICCFIHTIYFFLTIFPNFEEQMMQEMLKFLALKEIQSLLFSQNTQLMSWKPLMSIIYILKCDWYL